ncbi:MAG: PDZ domain-containing protein [Flavisolibacter sp.]
MKQFFVTRWLMAGVILLSVPSVTRAQNEKEKVKEDKKEMQTIVITRDPGKDGKTLIEIDGDKVKINGKDAKDNKDVNVNVTTMKGMGTKHWRINNRTPRAENWNLEMDGDQMSLFSEDENRAMLGVNTTTQDKGAAIESVTKGSAAEKGGLKKDDIITAIDDKRIETADEVTEVIHGHKPGDEVEIKYLRDGKEQKTKVELGKWKGIRAVQLPRIAQSWNQQAPMPPSIDMAPFENFDNSFAFSGRPRLGLSIQDTDDGKGVKVLDVDDESNAAKAGLKEGDVILSIDDKEVKGTEDVTRTLRENKEKFTYNFKIQRDGKTQTLEVKMPRRLKTAEL